MICGSADNIWDDRIRAHAMMKKYKYDVACINYTALYYPYFFQHWISLHPDLFVNYRKFIKRPRQVKTHSNRIEPEVDKVWNIESWGSDSGLFACKVALGLGYNRIVVCGCPLDSSKKFYELLGTKQGFDATNNLQNWKEDVGGNADIRSMSGNTKQILGEPTLEWLGGLK